MKIAFLLFILTLSLQASIGKISAVKGDAYVERFQQHIKAVPLLPLELQDVVITKQARLQMQFVDHTVISMGRNSEFAIEEYLYDDQEPSNCAASFSLKEGIIKAVTGLIGKYNARAYSVKTNHAVVTVKGTIWTADIKQNSERFDVVEGHISVSYMHEREHVTRELHAGESLTLKIDPEQHTTVEAVQSANRNKPGASRLSGEDRMELIETDHGDFFEDERIQSDDDEGDGNRGHGNDPDKFDPDNPGEGG